MKIRRVKIGDTLPNDLKPENLSQYFDDDSSTLDREVEVRYLAL